MTAAMASMSRPKVSSLDRFGGGFADVPGAGSGSPNFAVTCSDPIVPTSFAEVPEPWTARSAASDPPFTHDTSPSRRLSWRRNFALGPLLKSTNWPDWLSLKSVPRHVDVDV